MIMLALSFVVLAWISQQVSGESVDTQVSSTLDCFEASMVYDINGSPLRLTIFFKGIPLLPPLAGITDITFILILCSILQQ